jgi:hypothetical protein
MLIGNGKKCQGTTLQLAEMVIGNGKKCQGTALVVPKRH